MKANQLLIIGTILFFSFSSKTASAQIALGIKGGLSIPNLSSGSSSNPLNSGYSSRLGFDGAVFADFHISRLFSIQPQIEYSSQGGKKDGMQAFPNPYGPTPPYLYANYNSETKLNYLLIPVLAKFKFNLGGGFKLYAMAGPNVGFLLSAKQVNSGTSPIYADPQGQQVLSPSASFDTTENVKSSLQSTNYGIEGAIGISYAFGNSNVFIEGGGNYGFVTIQKDAADGQDKTGAASVLVGYSYKLP
ncbi:MAG: porin family protein [Ferruginibacter sp.]